MRYSFRKSRCMVRENSERAKIWTFLVQIYPFLVQNHHTRSYSPYCLIFFLIFFTQLDFHKTYKISKIFFGQKIFDPRNAAINFHDFCSRNYFWGTLSGKSRCMVRENFGPNLPFLVQNHHTPSCSLYCLSVCSDFLHTAGLP